MTHSGYVKGFFSIVAFTITVLATANLIIDPYGIFNTRVLPIAVEPSTYFNKIKQLEKNRGHYNGFMLGSSGIGFTPTEYIERYLPGVRVYNLWVSSATQYENLKHVQYLIKRQAPKAIYLQVDMEFALAEHRHGSAMYARKLHPLVEETSLPLYLFGYLTIFPLDRIRDKLVANIRGQVQSTLTDFDGTGSVRADAQEALIRADGPAYVRNSPQFQANPGPRFVSGRQTSRNIRALAAIHELCAQHGIKLIVFIHPESRVSMDKFLLPDYLAFLRQLASVTDYWDFSGYNSVTTDDTMYYEPGHYRPVVSRLIAAKIFNDRSIAVPADFGTWVTQSNFDDHALALTRQFRAQDAALATY